MDYVETTAPPPKRKTGPKPKYPFGGMEPGTAKTITVDTPGNGLGNAQTAFYQWCKRRGWTGRTEIIGNAITFYRVA